MSYKILVVAGEASSDLHTANLIKEIKKTRPDIFFYGLGGNMMRQAGVEIIYNIVDLAVVGFVEVIKHYSLFKKIFCQLVDRAKNDRPNLAILVDYPGFNLRLARVLKELNIPVIYYISPQIWAWGGDRIELIKQTVNKMLVLFKFEERLYKDAGVNVDFVGHPLLDIIPLSFDKSAILRELAISTDKKIVSLMPGSRENEVKRILPIMLKASSFIKKKTAEIIFLVIKSPTLPQHLYDKLTNQADIPLQIVEGKNYEVINASSLVLVASGTATLEVGILKRPMIIIYKVALLTYIFSKILIRLPYIGLVNVVAGKKIIDEFLQYNTRPEDIAKEGLKILSEPEIRDKIITNLSQIRGSLGQTGAIKRASASIVDFIASSLGAQ